MQKYGNRTVVSGISLQWGAGILGLLGPNGAGKTTLLRTLATVVPPSSGTLRIFGRTVESAATVREARRRIGYVPQQFGFPGGFSVYDFVRYCAWLREVPEKIGHDSTLRAIDQVGLSSRREWKLKKLSGGMQRRCAIAQAIVGDIHLLLLDEPTAGLDPEQRLEFRELMRSLDGISIVVSTHLVEDVASICDEVRVMRDGAFVFGGSVQDLAALGSPGARGDSPVERGYLAAIERPGARA
ncbi:ABC transporter ATP-binding protein [Plantactinospora sp. KLBMP9567]|uniref:ABC transporter ATP-binding protein n=1 Tax=Plantactinospora sp. KLBMP9567 TaxID=3085900 RepID=UPI0039905107